MKAADSHLCVHPKQFFLNAKLPIQETAGRWIHEHATFVKVCEIAAVILGSAMLAVLPIAFPIIGFSAIALAVFGGGIATIAAVAYMVLDRLFSSPHDMARHVFKPGSCEGGRLYYLKDVPILELDMKNPYQAGHAHGYLLGKNIHILRKRMQWALAMIERWPNAKEIPHILANIKQKIPEKYLSELKGIVDGHNKWAKEQRCSPISLITVDELLLFNLLPDKYHFDPKAKRDSVLSPACTVVLHRDQKEGIVMGRNMDWPSLGILGTHSLLIKRKYNDFSTVDIAIPGMIAVVTGMNSHGFSLAMNVCHGDDCFEERLPAGILNRMCLEKSEKVEQANRFLDSHFPMGSYHLTVADKDRAQTYHLYQDKTYGNHYVRKFREERPLVVTNCQFEWKGAERSQIDWYYSFERKKMIDAFWKKVREKLSPEKQKIRNLVTHCLALPFVDNFLTTHKIIMLPKLRKIGLAFDNGFAGSRPLRWLSSKDLFNHWFFSK